MQIMVIETIYKKTRFRSRLEARWAVFYDELKLKWDYEPEGYILDDGTWYLPDFWLPELNCFAEVKPKQFTPFEFSKCSMLSTSCLLLDGRPETFKGYYITGIEELHLDYKNYIDGENWGRVMFVPSANHKRLWFLWGETPDSYWLDNDAEVKSMQYRFGEGGRG